MGLSLGSSCMGCLSAVFYGIFVASLDEIYPFRSKSALNEENFTQVVTFIGKSCLHQLSHLA